MAEEEMAIFENEVYKSELTEDQKYFLTSICHLAQYALAHQEAGLDAIETADGQTTSVSLLWYTNDRHERLLGTHPALVEL